MKPSLVIIGGGLSGLAAGIRYARYSPDVLILERHSRIGGLNSFFYRNGILIETGLHAITNYAEAKNKKAPLNKIFRQLKLDRATFELHEQLTSEICFPDRESLFFSNNFELVREQIAEKFPRSINQFDDLTAAIDTLSFSPSQSFKSARTFLQYHISDPLLCDMLLCPLLYYGSGLENDMDLDMFAVMFRSVFQEGLFRPRGTIKDFLEMLLDQYKRFGGSLRLQSPVARIVHDGSHVSGVELKGGEMIPCSTVLSTIGYVETLRLLGKDQEKSSGRRLGFLESIFLVKPSCRVNLPKEKTIIFYNQSENLHYERPKQIVDFTSGVICFPENFKGLEPKDYFEIRSTHLADYNAFLDLAGDGSAYQSRKTQLARNSAETIEKIIGSFMQDIVYEYTFTPLTIERFTAKKEGAIYGRPQKIKDGRIGYDNLFLAGTDQGLLGIIGSMLSGITMVNRHILPAL